MKLKSTPGRHNFQRSNFPQFIHSKVRQGDLTAVFADAIINPASPDGTMSAGSAGAIKKVGGDEIEEEAMKDERKPVRVPTYPRTAFL